MKGIKTQKGITLIALIITIVVLLILTMVAISAIQDSSILTHAERSAIMHEVGTISEKIRVESQAIKLETAQGGSKTQTVENALINLYADNNATPIQIEIESATSIPEGITAGKYYVVIPEYLDYNIARGKGYSEDPITKDTFVVDDEFNVYYIVSGVTTGNGGGDNPIPEDIANKKDLSVIGYIYSTIKDDNQPYLYADHVAGDGNKDGINDSDPTVKWISPGYNVPITLFDSSPSEKITAVITYYNNTQDTIELSTTDNKIWKYSAVYEDGKFPFEGQKKEYSIIFKPNTLSTNGNETESIEYHYLFVGEEGDSSWTTPIKGIDLLGAEIEFTLECCIYLPEGQTNIEKFYEEATNVSKIIVNYSNSVQKVYTAKDGEIKYNQYNYVSKESPVTLYNGEICIFSDYYGFDIPIVSVIVEENGVFTQYNIVDSTTSVHIGFGE